ncbi:MAG: hypothetical protein HON92_15725 [Planctomycetaceae bacterium]|jgi:hypothetical protein|nr:hypothetical protein [Planctomycetaceae bacterium]MBT4724363.1 hypothetical protein [Planctomycetaceae bacterium]MBT4846878.1 hypothetical protein [Planctomycetaceae bacterium]MBT5123804.1 hypothetical protein [Planctomycetaceae bacterium]MBT5597904.1 hypothetical protein [Planctomycetaceae bacterium]
MFFAHLTSNEHWIIPAAIFFGTALGATTTVLIIKKLLNNNTHSTDR